MADVNDLKLSLLGPFQANLQGKPVAFPYDKVRALLAYLAVEARTRHRREMLAALLWPEQSAAAGRTSLRTALAALRRILNDRDASIPLLLVERDSVQLNPNGHYCLDVDALRSRLKASEIHPHHRVDGCETCIQDLEAAVALYRGDFLQGLNPGGSVEFEDWTLIQREHFHARILTALHNLTQYYTRKGQYGQAQRYALQQVAMEPFREEAHRALMQILANSGQRSAALAQYQTCGRILAEELGVEPSQETRSLYERIRQSGESRPNNLPAQLVSLIGRDEDLAQVADRLANPDCRLLTLTGPGGIGKTSLALHAARKNQSAFLNGVYFVPLGTLVQSDQVLTAIVSALPFSLEGGAPPRMQLFNYLRGKSILLVMDNMEHLMDAAELMNELLEQAPHLQILVTSRERLNLRSEWVMPLGGLPYPKQTASINQDTLSSYGASQLFIQRAQQIMASFVPTRDQSLAIAHICEFLLGSPLGIELAAAWTPVHSLDEIEAEIQKSLDFLATSMRDVQPRHRSLRATFEHSWDLLLQEEQDVLLKLSVFRGTFNSDAAHQVAGATPFMLASLADKSLLQSGIPGRYRMHPLVQQFAAEKLAADTQTEHDGRERHGLFFTSFLGRMGEAYHQEKRREILEEIHREIDNVRASWAWAVAEGQWMAVGRAHEALYDFFDAYGWYQEGCATFEQAISSLSNLQNVAGVEKNSIMGRLLARQGRLCIHLGQQKNASEQFQKSLSLLNDRDDRALPLGYLGVIAHMQGDYALATKYAEESLSISREIGGREGEAFCLNLLGNVALAKGELDQAKNIHTDNLAIRREIGDHLGAAIALNNLGSIAHAQGAPSEAKELYKESYAGFKVLNYRLGMAATLSNVGYMAWKLGAYDEAKPLYKDSLVIKRDLGHQQSIAITLSNLGELATSLGELDEAESYLCEALSLLTGARTAPLMLEILLCYACWLVEKDEKVKAVELLALCQEHPSSKHDTQNRAAQVLVNLAEELTSDLFALARERGRAKDLNEMVLQIAGTH